MDTSCSNARIDPSGGSGLRLAEPSILNEIMASGRLPSPTGVALTILDLTRNPDTKIDDMAAVLQADPALTGQLLKYANSATAGADDYLVKPLNHQMLSARLGAAERVIRLQDQADKAQEETRQTVIELGILNRQLKQMAMEDQLTLLPNRRAGLQHLDQEWARASRTGDPLLCMLLDIDHFKAVNDTHGHDAGDVVLKQTADVLKTAVQDNQIQSPDFQGQITVSVGVAIRDPRHTSPKDLIKDADEALYAAKDAGRNLVCIADPAS